MKVPEMHPVNCNCNIHPWMKGYLIVQDHPYVAVSGKDGTFAIKSLPAGKWTFRAWHEESGYVQEVSLGGKTEEWKQGKFEQTIKNAAVTDLGQIVISPEQFEDK
jgi:hypothetical protein